MLLCFYVNLRCCTTSFMDSLLGSMDLRPRERAAGATHVQISWISAWIPSEVTRTFFFDLPIWDSNSSSFSCRSFSSQREPTVVGSIIVRRCCRSTTLKRRWFSHFYCLMEAYLVTKNVWNTTATQSNMIEDEYISVIITSRISEVLYSLMYINDYQSTFVYCISIGSGS